MKLLFSPHGFFLFFSPRVLAECPELFFFAYTRYPAWSFSVQSSGISSVELSSPRFLTYPLFLICVFWLARSVRLLRGICPVSLFRTPRVLFFPAALQKGSSCRFLVSLRRSFGTSIPFCVDAVKFLRYPKLEPTVCPIGIFPLIFSSPAGR